MDTREDYWDSGTVGAWQSEYLQTFTPLGPVVYYTGPESIVLYVHELPLDLTTLVNGDQLSGLLSSWYCEERVFLSNSIFPPSLPQSSPVSINLRGHCPGTKHVAASAH